MTVYEKKKTLSENECTETILKGIKKALKKDNRKFKCNDSEIVVNDYTKKDAIKLLTEVIGKPIEEIKIGLQLTEANGSVFIRAKYKTY